MVTEDALEHIDEWLDELCRHSPASPSPAIAERLEAMVGLVSTLQIRDIDLTPRFHELLVRSLVRAWAAGFEPHVLRLTYLFFTGMLHVPELDAERVIDAIGHEFISTLFERLMSERLGGKLPRGFGAEGGGAAAGRAATCAVHSAPGAMPVGGVAGAAAAAGVSAASAHIDPPDEIAWLRTVLHWVYAKAVALRPTLRARIGLALVRAASASHPPPGTLALLEVLRPIISGFGVPARPHGALLLESLLPLHRPAGKVDGMGPVLGAYHKQLVACELPLLRAQPELLEPFLVGLLSLWPHEREGNSAKEVLLLHEVEALVEGVRPSGRLARACAAALTPVLLASLQSENSRVAERSLLLFQSEPFLGMVDAAASSLCFPLVHALLRNGRPHWNPTVNRMTYAVLQALRERDEGLFRQAAAQAWGHVNQGISSAAAGAAVARSQSVGTDLAAAAEAADAVAGVLPSSTPQEPRRAPPRSNGPRLARLSGSSAAAPQLRRPSPLSPRSAPRSAQRRSFSAEAADALVLLGEQGTAEPAAGAAAATSEPAAPPPATTAQTMRPPLAPAPSPLHPPERSLIEPSAEPPQAQQEQQKKPPKVMTVAPWSSAGRAPPRPPPVPMKPIASDEAEGAQHGGGGGGGGGGGFGGASGGAQRVVPMEVGLDGGRGGDDDDEEVDEDTPDCLLMPPPPPPAMPPPRMPLPSAGSGALGGTAAIVSPEPGGAAGGSEATGAEHDARQPFRLDLGQVSSAAQSSEHYTAPAVQGATQGHLRRPRASTEPLPDGADDDSDEANGTGDGAAPAAHEQPSSEAERRWAQMESYLERIRPVRDTALELSVERREHLEHTPVQLDSILFQDLVFGAELGRGTFSKVWYCKHIQRGLPSSAWPEYGAKVINKDTIASLGYEANVQREIAILREMQHVSIARLVASFRWKRDVYLMLEYAGRGDLHNHLRALGSLSEESARFVCAEVVSGLRYIHSLGFVFADLKPENILLTHSGHAKLTDFGAARALRGHPHAEALLAGATDVLKDLRDGDWRSAHSAAEWSATHHDGGTASAANGAAPMPMEVDGAGWARGAGADAEMAGAGEEEAVEGADGGARAEGAPGSAEAEMAEAHGGRGSTRRGADEGAAAPTVGANADHRLEGTTAYLAPELVGGAFPSVASDCWALGCTLYQMLAGKPPLWADSSAEMMRRIVHFDAGALGDVFPPGFSAVAQDAVCALLVREPERRLGGAEGGIGVVVEHAFFDGLPPLDELYRHTPPKLGGGAVAPAPNAAWARRQNSVMWSPLPAQYNFTEQTYKLEGVPETEQEANAWFGTRLSHGSAGSSGR